MLKLLLLAAWLLTCANLSFATSYYFSSVSGDDSRSALQAGNPATPWKTLAKHNAVAATLKPGDSVFFKRGEVFFGNLAPTVSGTAGAVIYYGAFGTGASPLITGFTSVSGWVLQGNGIYYAPVTASNLQIITINGAVKGRGRWPNTGYLKVDSHVGNQSITSTGLAGAPVSNWSGGEIVMRKYRFILDRHTVTAQSGNTLTYNTSGANGWNSGYAPVNGNGFFIQNHLSALDLPGEWCYNATARRLYVHFGADAPANSVVKVSTQDFNVSLTSLKFLTFENLDFEGGNTKGLNMSNCSNITIANCNFNNEGAFGISGKVLNTVKVLGGSISNALSNAINFDENAYNCTVEGVTVTNTNMIAGTGRSGAGVGNGITVNGGSTRIAGNRVVNSGYSGIQFLGDNVVVEKNYVDGFCYLKDDGGGIYTFNGPSNTPEYNRIVRNNIVLNAIGNFESAKTYWWEGYGKAAGIYLDEYVNNVQVTGNTIANGDWAGIFIHNTHTCQLTNNIIYNHRYQIHLSQYSLASRNMLETGNQYIAKLPWQITWFYRTYITDVPSTMGISNNNYFARPIDDNKTIRLGFLQNSGGDTTDISLAQWQASYGLDLASKKSPITYTANINDSIRFEYNASDAVKSVALDADYIDVTGNTYSGTLTLNPWTSVVLLKSKTQSGPGTKQSQVITFAALPGKVFGDAPFTLNATASSGLPVSFRIVSGPATISGTTVTLTGAGVVGIEATQAGNSTYNAATPVTQTFTVNKASQTITFAALSAKTFGDAPFTLSATASSGLPVSFSVVSGPATVSGNTVTLTGAGTVVVEATQPGDGNYSAAAAVSQSFVVARASQTITFAALPNKTFGDAPFTLTATASSGLAVSFRIVSGPATISGNTVTLTGAGVVQVEASQVGNTNYSAALAVVQSFTVNPPVITKQNQVITFPVVTTKTFGNPPFALSATASSGLPVSYRVVSGPATLSGNMVTLTGAGTVTIEASQSGDAAYNAAPAISQSFVVSSPSTTKLNQTITFPTLAYKTYTSPPFALTATASSGLPVSYRVVSGPVTVTGNMVTITGVGSVTIEASQAGSATYNAATPVLRSFTIGKASQTITFPAISNKLFGDLPFALNATASSGLPVSYRLVSGPAIVNGNIVTLTGTGTVVIEASQAGNTFYSAAYSPQRSFTATAPITRAAPASRRTPVEEQAEAR